MTTNVRPLIAIIDDDVSICRALSRLVRSLEMDAETFPSGQAFFQKLESLQSFHPDCVVLDIQMPGKNGLVVQGEIRRCRSRLPVIFITAHDEVGLRERALAAGAMAYLCKPFNDTAFAETLRAALEQRAGRERA